MAVGAAVRKQVGRLVFYLVRGEERTTRTLDISYPKTDITDQEIQEAVNTTNNVFTTVSNGMNLFIQPAAWRDTNIAEEQWTTESVSYEVVETITQEITPSSNRADNQLEENHEEQRSEENQQGEWNG